MITEESFAGRPTSPAHFVVSSPLYFIPCQNPTVVGDVRKIYCTLYYHNLLLIIIIIIRADIIITDVILCYYETSLPITIVTTYILLFICH